MDQKNEKCPFCGSFEIIPVIYGYATFDLLVRVLRSELVLGGMCVEEGQAQRKCLSCESLIPAGVSKQ